MAQQDFTQGRKKKYLIIILVLALVIGFGLIVFLLSMPQQGKGIGLLTPGDGTVRLTIQDLHLLWEQKEYKDVVEKGESNIVKFPLNFEIILLTAYAQYYRGISLMDVGERQDALNRSISLLRKALVLEPFRDNSDVYYILGKAYYGLGYFHHDLALKYLVLAEKAGFHQADMDEFLGVVYAAMGEPEKALMHFSKANDKQYDDSIQLAIVTTYLSMEKPEDAIKTLDILLSRVQDPLVQKKARFIKGDLLFHSARYDDALVIYLNVLKDDPGSADAHYYVGEIYNATGDPLKARAEWRSAVLLDPSHSAALNRLNNN